MKNFIQKTAIYTLLFSLICTTTTYAKVLDTQPPVIKVVIVIKP